MLTALWIVLFLVGGVALGNIPLNLNYLSRALERGSDCVLCREGSITLALGGVSCLAAGHLHSCPLHARTAKRFINS
jgi:hypothetical protein